jgi:CHAT domain-containing protein/Tfp pilus assembly protein PilF
MPGVETPSPEQLLESLRTEPQKRRRVKLLNTARFLWNPELVTRFYDESSRLARIDLRQAERIAEATRWMSLRVEDEASRASGLRAVGHISYLKANYIKAIDCYREALEIYERLGMEVEAGRTMAGNGMQTLAYLGKYEEAFEWAERSRGIFLRHGARHHLAVLDHNMANVLYRLDRFEEAIDLYERSHREFLELGESQNAAIALKNTATCQISLNQFRQALETYTQAREYCLKYDMPLVAVEADYNIAYLYYLRGEYTRAIELYRLTRERCAELGDAYHQGLCDLDQAEMYLELNLSEEGGYLAERALDAFRQLGMGYEMAKAITNLGIASSHHGNAAQAVELFRKAREIFVRENNRVWTAMIDLYQALVTFQEGRLAEASHLCEKAFEFFDASPLAGKAALCRLLLARVRLRQQRTDEAKALCEDALRRLEQAETPVVRYQAWFVMGLIEEASGAPDAAYRAYLEAHDRLENLRSHLKTEETKIAFLKDKLSVYESLVRMCFARGDSPAECERAFAFIEQAKSRSLADLIALRGERPPTARQAQTALIEQAASLREELMWYTRAIQLLESGSATLRPPHLEKLRRAARECEQRLVETMTSLRDENPDLANVEQGSSIDLESIRGVLPDDAILLQYYRVQDTLHACVLSNRSLRIVPVCGASEARRVLQLLRFQLSKFRLGADYVSQFQPLLLEAANAHLRSLYDSLIRPIRDHLDRPHLIVAPHEFLHYLPFHALLDGRECFGDRYSISYTPSASVHYLCATKAPPTSEGALVLGVPDPSAPQILEETRAVAKVLPNAEVFLGPDATQNVLRDKGARSRFVHIATHGWFRQDNPMFSSISLGDRQLSLFDLYQLSLPAELVTLSGCGTGLNVVVGGDELLGLKRGLLYAGAQSILLTLWDVHDQSTAEFMKLFYSRLASSPNKAEAVQYAMAEIRKAYPHPFYWAPFVLVGKR